MRYLSVCSGIEAASVAWHPLGWTPVAFSEIEPFPSAVLAHRFPTVPNYGDMTAHATWPLRSGDIDLLVGGTPCQSFSVAGLRKGISDPRGGLMLTYLEIARSLRPRWVVWENVPGVLSSGSGRDFGSFLGALGDLGYGWAYRVLDAQWVRTQRHPRAVPQRRRRVFVVGRLIERGARDATAAASVLFERESVQRNHSSRRAAGKGTSSRAEDCSPCVCSKWSKGSGGPSGAECGNLIASPNLGFTTSQYAQYVEGTGTLRAAGGDLGGGSETIVVGADCYNGSLTGDVAATIGTPGSSVNASGPTVMQAVAVQGTLIGRDKGGPCGIGASQCGAMYTLTNADQHGVAYPIQDGREVSKEQNGLRIGSSSDPSYTIDTISHPSVAIHSVVSALDCRIDAQRAQNAASGHLISMAYRKSKRAQSATDDETWVDAQQANTLNAFDVGERDTHAVAYPIDTQNMTDGHQSGGLGFGKDDSPSFTLSKSHSHAVAHAAIGFGAKSATDDETCVSFTTGNLARGAGPSPSVEVFPTLMAGEGRGTYDQWPSVMTPMTVRRLTPRECERLQGFPDDWTLVPHRGKPAADGPRYKAIGNSMAVNCMEWIGERIAEYESRTNT